MTGPGPRRLIHASTSLVLLVALAWGWGAFRDLMTVIAGLSLVAEYVRIRTPLGDRIQTWIPVFRPSERRRPSGAFWLVGGYALAAWFPAPAAQSGILCSAFADPVAAWAGSIARPRSVVSGSKTWVGSGAAAATAVGILLVTGMGLLPALLAGLGGSALERWSRPLDDNLVMAPGVAALLWVFTLT